MNPLISVIVPVYRVEPFLPRCLDSLRNQTYRNLEILLVDDGSPDNCGKICDEYAEKDHRFRVIHKENGGLSSARNAGLDAAAGEFIGFVDSDDWIAPQMYETLLSALIKWDAQLACCGRYDVREKTGEQKIGLCPKSDECLSGVAFAGRIFRYDGCDSSACDKLYRRELFNGVFFEEGHKIDDEYFTYQGFLQPRKVVCTDRVIYNYRKRASSVMGSPAAAEQVIPSIGALAAGLAVRKEGIRWGGEQAKKSLPEVSGREPVAEAAEVFPQARF